VIGSRTRSRELALQALYSYDLDPERRRSTLGDTLENAEVSTEVRSFAAELADGVLLKLGEIDKLISEAAHNWDMKRLARVDRNVLRLAIHELLDRDDIPPAVTIDEAIELGKRYSTAQSGAFVNGILDRIRRDLGLCTDDDRSAVPEPPVSDQPPTSLNPAEGRLDD
jgi:N utilization substance protein B